MDAIDGLVAASDNDSRDRFVAACVTEIVQRSETARGELETVMNRVGWGVSDEGPYPRVYAHEKDDFDTMQRLVQLPDLSAPWRAYFQEQLHKRG
jgi:hypothetical protein